MVDVDGILSKSQRQVDCAPESPCKAASEGELRSMEGYVSARHKLREALILAFTGRIENELRGRIGQRQHVDGVTAVITQTGEIFHRSLAIEPHAHLLSPFHRPD